tara:strand:- start:17758 stop:26772 length:9015 start_codon:yes stop_codon:yes gene_type:complete
MPGGKIQLINPSNIQDKHLSILTHNYDYVYNQYSNYKKINTILTPNNTLKTYSSVFNKSVYKITVPKNGDLLSNLYLELELPEIYNNINILSDIEWATDLKYKLVKNLKYIINGTIIQEFTMDSLYLYYKTKLDKHDNDIFNTISRSSYINNINGISNNDVEFSIQQVENTQLFYYNKNFNKSPKYEKLKCLIPIPAWFKKEPFPLKFLQFNNLEIEVTISPLCDLLMYKPLQRNYNLDDKKYQVVTSYIHNREDEIYVDIFLNCSTISILNSQNNTYTNSVYTPNYSITTDLYNTGYSKESITLYSLDNTVFTRYSANLTGSETKFEKCKRVSLPYFLDKTYFKRAKLKFNLINGRVSSVNIIDKGYGYFCPNPHGILSENPNLFTEHIECNIYGTTGVIDESNKKCVFDRTLLENSPESNLHTLFPKIIFTTKYNRNPIVLITKISILGEIMEVKIIDMGETIDENINTEYYIEYDINVKTAYIDFYTMGDYNSNSTIYAPPFKNEFMSAPLVYSEISYPGEYYVSSPKVYIYGELANFKTYINTYQGRIIKVDIIETPLGFNSIPDLKIDNLYGSRCILKPILAIFKIWNYPKDVFQNIIPNNFSPNNIGPVLGKPYLTIESYINKDKPLESTLVFSNNSINDYIIKFNGTNYKKTDLVSINYSKSKTSGRGALISKVHFTEPLVTVNDYNLISKLRDGSYNIKSGTYTPEQVIPPYNSKLTLVFKKSDSEVAIKYNSITVENYINRVVYFRYTAPDFKSATYMSYLPDISTIIFNNLIYKTIPLAPIYNEGDNFGKGFRIKDITVVEKSIKSFDIHLDINKTAVNSIFTENYKYDYNAITFKKLLPDGSYKEQNDIFINTLESLKLRSGVIAEYKFLENGEYITPGKYTIKESGHPVDKNSDAVVNITSEDISSGIINNLREQVHINSYENIFNTKGVTILHGGNNYNIGDIIKIKPINSVNGFDEIFEVIGLEENILTNFTCSNNNQVNFNLHNMEIFYSENSNFIRATDIAICDVLFNKKNVKKFQIIQITNDYIYSNDGFKINEYYYCNINKYYTYPDKFGLIGYNILLKFVSVSVNSSETKLNFEIINNGHTCSNINTVLSSQLYIELTSSSGSVITLNTDSYRCEISSSVNYGYPSKIFFIHYPNMGKTKIYNGNKDYIIINKIDQSQKIYFNIDDIRYKSVKTIKHVTTDDKRPLGFIKKQIYSDSNKYNSNIHLIPPIPDPVILLINNISFASLYNINIHTSNNGIVNNNIINSGGSGYNIVTEYTLYPYNSTPATIMGQILNNTLTLPVIQITKIYNNIMKSDGLQLSGQGHDMSPSDNLGIFLNNVYTNMVLKVNSVHDTYVIKNFESGDNYNNGDKINIYYNLDGERPEPPFDYCQYGDSIFIEDNINHIINTDDSGSVINEYFQIFLGSILITDTLQGGYITNVDFKTDEIELNTGDKIYITEQSVINNRPITVNHDYLTIYNTNEIKIKSVEFSNTGGGYAVGDKLYLMGGNEDAFVEIKSVIDGALTSINLKSNKIISNNYTFKINNLGLGTGIDIKPIFKYYNSYSKILEKFDIIKSGSGYNTTNPQVFLIPNELDTNAMAKLYMGSGIYDTLWENNELIDITPYKYSDLNSGSDFTIPPNAYIFGKDILETKITGFNSFGGISEITVISSYKWYPDSNTDLQFYYDNLTVKLDIMGVGTGLCVKPIMEKVNNEYIIISGITIDSPGINYNIDTSYRLEYTSMTGMNAYIMISISYNNDFIATIKQRGFGYKTGDKINIVSDYFILYGITNYIEVTNVGINGGIISIKINQSFFQSAIYSNKIGFYDTNKFILHPIMGIKSIAIINEGINYPDNIYLNNIRTDGQSNILGKDLTINISNNSVFGYLDIIDYTDKFNSDNSDIFEIITKNGRDLQLVFYNDIDTYSIINGEKSSNYNVNDIINLYYKNMIINSFIITKTGNLGSVLEIQEITRNNTNNYTSQFVINEAIFIQNSFADSPYTIKLDNIDALFEFVINSYGNCEKINILNKGKNIIEKHNFIYLYNIVNNTIVLNQNSNISNEINNYNIIYPFNEINNNPILIDFEIAYNNVNEMTAIHLINGRGYNTPFYIECINTVSYNNNDKGFLRCILNNTNLIDIQQLSGYGYRTKPNITIRNFTINSIYNNSAEFSADIIGFLDKILILGGGDGYDLNETIVWNSEENPGIELEFEIINGSISNIILTKNIPNLYSTPNIIIYPPKNNTVFTPISIEVIMNYSLYNINIINKGFGYIYNPVTDIEYNGERYVKLNIDAPIIYDQHNINAIAFGLLEDCKITQVFLAAGKFKNTSNNSTPIFNEDIILNSLYAEHNEGLKPLSIEVVYNGIEWIKYKDTNGENIYSIKNITLFSGNNYKTGVYKHTDLLYTINNENLFYDYDDNAYILGENLIHSKGYNLCLMTKYKKRIASVSSDSEHPGYNFNTDDIVYIIDKNIQTDTENMFNTIELTNNYIAKFQVKYIESNTIYNIEISSENIKKLIKKNNKYNVLGGSGVDCEVEAIFNDNSEFTHFICSNRGTDYSLPILGYTRGGLFENNIDMTTGKTNIIQKGFNFKTSNTPVYGINYNLIPEKQNIANNLNISSAEIDRYYNSITHNMYNYLECDITPYIDAACIINYGSEEVTIMNKILYNFKPVITRNKQFKEFTLVLNNINFIKLDQSLSDDFLFKIFQESIPHLHTRFLMEYIILDAAEQQRFELHTQEYIYESYETEYYTNLNRPISKIKLNTRGVSKKLSFLARRSDIRKYNELLNFTFNDNSYSSYNKYQTKIIEIITNELKFGNNSQRNFINYLEYFITENNNNEYLILPEHIFNFLYSEMKKKEPTIKYIKIKTLYTFNKDTAVDLLNIWKYRDINNIPFLNSDVSKSEIIKNIEIKFNKTQRQSQKPSSNYNILNKWKHSRISNNDNIYEYSFGLNSLQSEPSGHCNLSHINNIELIVEFNDIPANEIYDIELVVINTRYNILRLKNGMAETLL